jgi:hypothetical protein
MGSNKMMGLYEFWGWAAFVIALAMFVLSLKISVEGWRQKNTGYLMAGILGALLFGLIVFAFCFQLCLYFFYRA